MTDSRQEDIGIRGDPKRQAVDTLRGYAYQIWRSVHAWLELKDEDILFLECAEDFDVVSPETATAVQVKDTAANITLRSPAAIDAIGHYWRLRHTNPNRKICFRFLTRSKIGVEKGEPFGEGVRGLELWQSSSRDLEAAGQLRDFLQGVKGLPADALEFLCSASIGAIVEQLIAPITWETESADASYVEQAIRIKLILHGEKWGVPPSKAAAVVSRLLREVLTTAGRKDQRSLDRASFLRLFEEETTVRISTRQLQDLTSRAYATDRLLATLLGGEGGVFLQSASIVRTTIPPLDACMACREQLVSEYVVQTRATGALILTGSTGMGKTTLAKLVAKAVGGEWLWLNLSNRDRVQTTEALRQLAAMLEHEHVPTGVVLDDLNCSPAHARQYEDYLGGLLYTVLARSGHIVITSQKPLPDSLSRRLGLHPNSLHQVPLFAECEIARFAIRLGCPEGGLAWNRAKVILLHTQGHPQLVHACLRHMADAQWPSLKADEVLDTPPDVISERSDARKLLIDQLSEEQRELIYRLSIILGPFRRDHAVAIGERSPALQHAGDAFDVLIGPWIESLGSGYYCLSPLLKYAAKQVWSKERIPLLHSAIGEAILRCGRLTLIEARAAFLHGWMGRSGTVLVPVINGLLSAAKEVRKAVAQDLSLLVHAGLEPQRPLFPENAYVNFMLRMLQFQIAVDLEPQAAPLVIEAWNKESTSVEPHALSLLTRLLLTTKVLLSTGVEVPPKQLLAFLLELAKIQEQQEEVQGLREMFSSLETLPLDSEDADSFDLIMTFFGFVVYRCSSIRFLDDLLEGLRQTPDAIRRRLFAVFEIAGAATRLTDQVWLQEADREEPDWPACLQAFERVAKLAVLWGAPTLIVAAGRSSAIVYDEYLCDPDRAVAVLGEVAAQIGASSVILEDERATILLHQRRYEEALAIWEEVLPEEVSSTESSDPTFVFSYRNAGIAAGHTGEWKKAAHFFTGGCQCAQTLSKPAISIGLRADAGFAFWKAQQYSDAVEAFAVTLESLEQLHNADEDLASFAVKKLVGHALLLIEQTLAGTLTGDLSDPPPGMCSNPDYPEELRELPNPQVEIFWVLLAQIECHLELGSIVFDRVHRRFAQCCFPVVRRWLAHLDLQHAFRRLDFSHLPAQAAAFATAFQEMDRSITQRRNLSEEGAIRAASDDVTPAIDTVETEIFIAALVALAGTENVDTVLLQTWRDNSEGRSVREAIVEWINQAEMMLSLEAHEAAAIMRYTGETRERRLLAALRVGTEEAVAPDDLFYAHTLLAVSLLERPWANDIADYLAVLLTRRWSQTARFHAMLRTPSLTVPDILAACNSEKGGRQKVAQILLAASNAVSVRLSDELVTKLRGLTNT